MNLNTVTVPSANMMYIGVHVLEFISKNNHYPFSGTPAMTTRGSLESDFETIADYFFRAAQIASVIQRKHGKSRKTFLKGLHTNNIEILELCTCIEAFASQFAMPGFDI